MIGFATSRPDRITIDREPRGMGFTVATVTAPATDTGDERVCCLSATLTLSTTTRNKTLRGARQALGR